MEEGWGILGCEGVGCNEAQCRRLPKSLLTGHTFLSTHTTLGVVRAGPLPEGSPPSSSSHSRKTQPWETELLSLFLSCRNKIHIPCGLNSSNLLSHRAGGQKSKIKTPKSQFLIKVLVKS